MNEIDIKKALELTNPIFIDVRSPIEFSESHIPGAINIPIFTDEERVQVGTTYKVKGQDPARWLGVEIVSPKIPDPFRKYKKRRRQREYSSYLLLAWGNAK